VDSIRKVLAVPIPNVAKVERPSYAQLMAELEATSFCAVARTYGISDNAVRKWVRWYEADASRREAASANAPNFGLASFGPPAAMP